MYIGTDSMQYERRSPFPFGVKPADRDNFKGKQFKSNPPPEGKMPKDFYEKVHPWVAKVR